jgi:hypothetical protein
MLVVSEAATPEAYKFVDGLLPKFGIFNADPEGGNREGKDG